jgi:hypothetical protein
VEKVSGIGGPFFRAQDLVSPGKWYCDHLRIALVPSDYSWTPWSQEAGPCAPATVRADTSYFGNDDKAWMDRRVYQDGRFAHLDDPEDNSIELWELLASGMRLDE